MPGGTVPLKSFSYHDAPERFHYLDIVRLFRSGGLDSLEGLGGAVPSSSSTLAESMLISADYQPALRKANRLYDRLAAAARIKERVARRAEFDRIDKDLKALIPTTRFSKFTFWLGLAAGSAATRGERIGDIITVLVLPAAGNMADTEYQARQRESNLKLAVALAAFRNDAGRYPARLDELVPKYLAAVSKDLFSEKPPIYRTTENGYLLYSVGPNGKDDEGRNYHEDREQPYNSDDIAIRLPTAPLAAAKQ